MLFKMKRIYGLMIMVLATSMVMAHEDEGGVHFAYDAGAELVSAYIWRGQYNGGLSFQPDLEIGYDGDISSFRAGVWGNIGASDWKFVKGRETYLDADDVEIDPNTRFMPELDVMLRFSIVGASIGLNHYYYCDGSNFLSWKKDKELIAFDEEGNPYVTTTSTTEIWIGYSFEHLLGVNAYVNWYTTIAGNDFKENSNGDLVRAWSSYLELGYDYTFEDWGLTVGAQVGFSPMKSDLYGNNKFALTNITARIDKEWDLDVCSLDLFAVGSINPNGINKNNAYIKGSGDEKLYNQKLNGAIGLGIWF